jgi:hypothetical protein
MPREPCSSDRTKPKPIRQKQGSPNFLDPDVQHRTGLALRTYRERLDIISTLPYIECFERTKDAAGNDILHIEHSVSLNLGFVERQPVSVKTITSPRKKFTGMTLHFKLPSLYLFNVLNLSRSEEYIREREYDELQTVVLSEDGVDYKVADLIKSAGCGVCSTGGYIVTKARALRVLSPDNYQRYIHSPVKVTIAIDAELVKTIVEHAFIPF